MVRSFFLVALVGSVVSMAASAYYSRWVVTICCGISAVGWVLLLTQEAKRDRP
jgi:hypothetical protein